MWTTEMDRYGLVEVPSGYLVFDLETMAPMIIDDDRDVLEEVFANMRRAGVPILTLDEYRARSRGGQRR
ncbi:hypothetical protein AKJ09_06950 [Labilithrix luteola]|uniref:Uncharacterized protein n=1 Tax=Labilithrix luteola TaxID=1391654 RepID=A0A0K1Q3S5_9BACT|nr:hypothetical protein [Labilithrix luteola]AKV00287.1 hypothetical protein AKJ09_06950 [Labilithrix luteola]